MKDINDPQTPRIGEMPTIPELNVDNSTYLERVDSIVISEIYGGDSLASRNADAQTAAMIARVFARHLPNKEL